MSPLRQQLIRQMDLKYQSPHTRRSYLNGSMGSRHTTGSLRKPTTVR